MFILSCVCLCVRTDAGFVGQVFNMVAMFFQSLERLLEYLELPQEASRESTSPDIANNQKWPAAGAIVFEKASLRYKPQLPLALNGCSISIAGGEHIGVVGECCADVGFVVVTPWCVHLPPLCLWKDLAHMKTGAS